MRRLQPARSGASADTAPSMARSDPRPAAFPLHSVSCETHSPRRTLQISDRFSWPYSPPRIGLKMVTLVRCNFPCLRCCLPSPCLHRKPLDTFDELLGQALGIGPRPGHFSAFTFHERCDHSQAIFELVSL